MGLTTSDLHIPGGGTDAYHILRVQEASPGQKAGLEAFFDYIISINGIRLNQDNEQLKTILEKSINQPVQLTVFNARTELIRQVPLTPRNDWGGQVGDPKAIEEVEVIDREFRRVCWA